MSDVQHFDAVKALLQANADLANRISDTARATTTGVLVRDTYLVLFGGAPDVLASNRFAAAQKPDSDADYVYTVRAVSPTTDGVRRMASAAVTQLVGAVPTISGRACAPIRLTATHELQADNSALPPMFFTDMEFTLTSLKA